MQVVVIGITKERKAGVNKKTGNPFAGHFVVLGYERPDMHGYDVKNMLYTDEMKKENGGYLPAHGDVCECDVSFTGYITALRPVQV